MSEQSNPTGRNAGIDCLRILRLIPPMKRLI